MLGYFLWGGEHRAEARWHGFIAGTVWGHFQKNNFGLSGFRSVGDWGAMVRSADPTGLLNAIGGPNRITILYRFHPFRTLRHSVRCQGATGVLR